MEFVGTDGDDRIAGTSKADVILSGEGNDTIFSGAGDDVIITGDGNNFINAGTGDDVIITGNGNNLIAGGDGNDIIIAGNGDDIIAGDAGDDVISGGGGADVFQFKAGFGHDIITDFNFAEGDYINLYAGAVGNAKNIQLKSASDIDALVTSGLATKTFATDGSLLLTFNTGDSIKLVGYAASAKQNVAGTSKDDVLIGGPNGNVHITGGKGDDILISGPTATLSEGGAGNDVLVGNIGVDKFSGTDGNDVLSGGRGDDQLNGALGNDILSGGSGADLFSFTDKLGSWGNDLITDFNFGEGDYLNLNYGGTLTKITTISQLNDFAANSGAIVSGDAISATLTLGANESIRFIGLHASSGQIV